MENAVKALLIAAGIFLVILISSLLMVFYQQISDHYNTEHESAVIEQTQKLNSQFENYNRKNIRGSDMISLMNRIIDYNASQSYQDGTGYKRIGITIELGESNLDLFKYEDDTITNRNSRLRATITNTSGANWSTDRQLIDITQTPKDLIQIAKTLGIDITDIQLQQLASNISNLFIDETSEDYSVITNRFYRKTMIEDILEGVIISVDSETAKGDTDKIKKIQDIASQYYQYMQFKRAYFDCEEVIYDPDTNRVESMKFKLQTKIVDGKETIVFD